MRRRGILSLCVYGVFVSLFLGANWIYLDWVREDREFVTRVADVSVFRGRLEENDAQVFCSKDSFFLVDSDGCTILSRREDDVAVGCGQPRHYLWMTWCSGSGV